MRMLGIIVFGFLALLNFGETTAIMFFGYHPTAEEILRAAYLGNTGQLGIITWLLINRSTS